MKTWQKILYPIKILIIHANPTIRNLNHPQTLLRETQACLLGACYIDNSAGNIHIPLNKRD
jgi:hypothetical protein